MAVTAARAVHAVSLFADAAEIVPALECCFGTSPTQAEKSRPDEPP